MHVDCWLNTHGAYYIEYPWCVLNTPGCVFRYGDQKVRFAGAYFSIKYVLAGALFFKCVLVKIHMRDIQMRAAY